MPSISKSSVAGAFCRKFDRSYRGIEPTFYKNGNIRMSDFLGNMYPSGYVSGKSLVWNLCKTLGIKKTTAQKILKIKATTKTDAIRQMALLLNVNPKEEIDHRW